MFFNFELVRKIAGGEGVQGRMQIIESIEKSDDDGTTGDVNPLNTGLDSVIPAGNITCHHFFPGGDFLGQNTEKKCSSGNSKRFGKRTSGIKSELLISLSFPSAPVIIPNFSGLPRKSLPVAPQSAVVKYSNAEAPV